MFLRFRTQGIIFKKEEKGEADFLFSVYTRDFGKLKILAKGIRKVSAKLKGEVEIFSISEIEFIEGKFQKKLVGAKILERFSNFKKNLAKLSLAFKISELLDCLIEEGEKDERIFELIKECFSRLNLFFFKKIRLLYLYFFWNLILLLGYKPILDFCSLCQRKNQIFYFNFSLGGLICKKCFENVKIGEEVDFNLIKFLKLIFKKNLDFLERLKVENKILDWLFLLSQKYFNFLKEK